MNSSTSDTKSVSVGQSAPVKRTRLIDINEWITCYLCGGYLIDAMTLIECQTLHSFCKSCIFTHLRRTEQQGMAPVCPTCDEPLNESKPHLSMRQDTKLQDIVYKLVPGLYKREMERRKEFYKRIGSQDPKGEVGKDSLFYVPSDKISLSLEYHLSSSSTSDTNSTATASDNSPATNNGTNHKRKAEMDGNNSNGNNPEMSSERRYLLCEAGMPVYLLKKFIVQKYSLDRSYQVHLMYNNHLLTDDLTLMDVIYIYSWCSNDPMRFYYTIEKSNKKLRTVSPITIETCERLDECKATDHLVGHRKDKERKGNELLSPQEENKRSSIVSPLSTSNCSSDSSMSATSPRSKHHHHHHKKKKEKEPKPTFHAVPTSRGVTIKKDVSPQVSPMSKDQPQGSMFSPPSASAAVSSVSAVPKGVPSPPSVPIVASPPMSMVVTPSVTTVTTPSAMPIKTIVSAKMSSSSVDSKKRASPAIPSSKADTPVKSSTNVVTNGTSFNGLIADSKNRSWPQPPKPTPSTATKPANGTGPKKIFESKKMKMSSDASPKPSTAPASKVTNGQIFKEKFAEATRKVSTTTTSGKVTTPTTSFTKFGSMAAANGKPQPPPPAYKQQHQSGNSAIGQSNNKQVVKSSSAIPSTYPIKPSLVKLPPPLIPTVPTTSTFLASPSIPNPMSTMAKIQGRNSPTVQSPKVQDRSSPFYLQNKVANSMPVSKPLIKVPSFSSLSNKSFGPNSSSSNLRTPSPSQHRVSSPSQHRVSSPSTATPRVVSPFTSLSTPVTKSLSNPTSFPIPKLPPPLSLPSPLQSSLSALKMVNGMKGTPDISSQKPSHTIQDILRDTRDTTSQLNYSRLNGFKSDMNHNHHLLPRIQVSKSPSSHIPIQQIKQPRQSLDQVLNRISKNQSHTTWPPPPFPVDLSCASGNKPN